MIPLHGSSTLKVDHQDSGIQGVATVWISQNANERMVVDLDSSCPGPSEEDYVVDEYREESMYIVE